MVCGSDMVVTAGVALMVRPKALVAVPVRLSVTFNEKLNRPEAGGVPLSVPPGAMASHTGSVLPGSANA